jgi:hypothetical protein
MSPINWLSYFKWNRAHRSTIAWQPTLELAPHLRAPLIRSLQKFQVGESGEGRHLREHAAKTGDANYAAAIELFIKEEQEHARVMACILSRLNAPLLEGHWSNRSFILMRRLFGLHQELMVLLLPEMIAKRYFRALHDGSTDPVLKAVFAQICHDEDGHVAFHIDYLHQAFKHLSLPTRAAARCLWRILFRGACLVVILDHGRVLRAMGVSAAEFWWDTGLIFDETAAGIFSYSSKDTITENLFGRTPGEAK